CWVAWSPRSNSDLCFAASNDRPELTEVRQGIVGFGFFRSQNDSKRHACNDGMRKPRCSVDQPSCKLIGVVTRSAQNVLAGESPQQRRQGAHLLVAGGDGANSRGSAPEDAMLLGRAEQFGAGALAEDGGGL